MEGAHVVSVSDGAGECGTDSSTSPVGAGEDKQLESATSTECAAVEGICAAPAAGAGSSKKSSSARSTKPKIKRPMNAFMVWSSHERKRLAEKEPTLHNTQLSVRLGQIWKGMSEKEKSPFKQEALKLKQKLLEEHPDYKYRPRRRKLENHLKTTNCFFATSAPVNSLPYHELLPAAPMYQTQIPIQATAYPHQVHDGNQSCMFSPMFINSPPYYVMDPSATGSDASGMKTATTISMVQNGLETPPCSPSPYVTSKPVHTYAIPPTPTATQSCSSPLESRPVTSACVSGSGNPALCHIQTSPPHLSPPPLTTTQQQPPFRATPPLLAESPSIPPQAPPVGYSSYQQYDWYNFGSTTAESTPISQPAYANVQMKPEGGYGAFVQAAPSQHPYSSEVISVASEPLKSEECRYETIVSPSCPPAGQNHPCPNNYQPIYALLTPEMTPSASSGSPSFF